VAHMIIFTKSVLIDHSGLPKVDYRKSYLIKGQYLPIISQVTGEFLPIISDMVVVWRAWTIFPAQRRVMTGPIALLICTIVATILHLLSLYNYAPSLLNNGPVSNGLWTAAIAASIATNLTATLLISYNLWYVKESTKSMVQIQFL